MKLYFETRQIVVLVFVVTAAVIAAASVLFSNNLVKKLAVEERNKIEIWAEATQVLAQGEENADMNLVLKIMQNNTTIPVILYDMNSVMITGNNLSLPDKDHNEFMKKKIKDFAKRHDPIYIDAFDQYVYYDDSYTLKQLQLYPYVQLGVIAIFIALVFFTLSSSLKAEQNKVWMGLSKETAHQLGTPISSLLAWTEYLKLKNVEPALLDEIGKDVERLQIISERFSKIGSKTDLNPVDFREVIINSLRYLERRLPKTISFDLQMPQQPLIVDANESLFSWVIENVTKNAVDAMSGVGVISFSLSQKGRKVFLDITDKGKGIHKSKQKQIFAPGYTTKERGWGLGLSLVKRIVEIYHGGKVFVKNSNAAEGTTFRIVLKSVVI